MHDSGVAWTTPYVMSRNDRQDKEDGMLLDSYESVIHIILKAINILTFGNECESEIFCYKKLNSVVRVHVQHRTEQRTLR